MAMLIDCLKSFCLTQGLEKIYWIAFSGGLDSSVLLHICAELRQQHPLQLRAIYINHGLSPHAASWAKHCAQICRDLRIDFTQKIISEKPSLGQSPEAFLRLRRYELFAELLTTNDCLLTAHQQDDQAETVLLQLLRGAGPKGLAAMPRIKRFGKGFHGRPLLDISREELQQYAEQKQLRWINDESNLDKNYTRNFLRHEVLPIFKKRWPTVTKTFARVAENCAEAEQIIETVATEDLSAVCIGEEATTLSINKLLQLAIPRQAQVLRAWLRKLQLSIPSAIKMKQIQKYFLSAAPDKSPYITWGSVELRRYRDALYVMKSLGQQHDVTQEYVWDLREPLVLPHLGILHAALSKDAGLNMEIKRVQVRFRQGGEYCRLPGRHCHHDLKKLFQEWGVPPWERERIPLLFVGEALVMVVGFFIDDRFLAKENEEANFISYKI